MLEFIPGKPLGINPFELNGKSEPNSEDLLYLNQLINLFHFKGTVNYDQIPQGHNVTIRKILDAYYKNVEELSMGTFYKFFEFIHKEKKYEDLGIDPSIYDPLKSMGEVIYSLSEFGDKEGTYSFLFEKP
ncbi:MAG: hypothetical protein U5K27_04670 [Desulfotignum sp.]|nr:hypothetical protein [Desulfotignum sp.]